MAIVATLQAQAPTIHPIAALAALVRGGVPATTVLAALSISLPAKARTKGAFNRPSSLLRSALRSMSPTTGVLRRDSPSAHR